MRRLFALTLLAVLALSAPAFAADWIAVKLRGEVLTLVGGQWQALSRGDSVADNQSVRTLASGRVVLARGEEAVELSANTEVRIVQGARTGFTTVHQAYGRIAVEAEVRNVQHFEVRTATMAAVVKGTRFVVEASRRDTEVTVERGNVAVECLFTHWSSLVGAGQSAANGMTQHLHVAGQGKLPPVLDARGNPVQE